MNFDPACPRSRKFKLPRTLTAAHPLERETRAEFTGGEGIQGAEAGGKLDVGRGGAT